MTGEDKRNQQARTELNRVPLLAGDAHPVFENLKQFSGHVRVALDVADNLRHDERLHRLAMQTVFALEDAHEFLVQAGAALSSPSPDDNGWPGR